MYMYIIIPCENLNTGVSDENIIDNFLYSIFSFNLNILTLDIDSLQ